MPKSKTENFDRIISGLEDVVRIVEGDARPARVYSPPQDVDVKAIREREGLTQDAFAAKYGFPTGTVRQWEQKRRRPEASARILLRVIEQNPRAVEQAIAN